MANEATAKQSAWENFSKGLLTENPSLRQMLGLCPTLAVTTAVTNGLGMGLATTFVLVCSGIAVSLLRKVIPNSVRIPAFITIIASFVTLTMMLVEAYLPALNDALGIYLPLIVVNCIVLGRAEMFASKNGVLDSLLDGVGMGLGYTLVITCIAVVRELVGSGTLYGVRIIPEGYQIGIITQTPGGFFMFGAAMALLIYCLGKKGRHFDPRIGCDGKCGNCSFNCENREDNLKLYENQAALEAAAAAAEAEKEGNKA